MVRYLVITLLLSAFALLKTYAQSNPEITGKIVDSTNRKPLNYASVALLNQADRKPVQGMQTDENGLFNFKSIPPGSYILRVGFVGYQTYQRSGIIINSNAPINLGEIRLRTSGANVLKEVVVEGTVPDMQIGIDRKVFNVDQSLVSQSGSVTDLLSDIPSISVDADGAVSLRGSSSVRILIDGKPSAMAGSDITQVLQSLPSNSVQRVEVITNPSSKYDAEGQSGIINIVLKKNLRTGLNGAVTASGGTYRNYNGGIALNYRDSSFNYYGNYDFRKFRRLSEGYSDTRYFENNGIIDNTNEGDRSGNAHTAKLGFDYFIDQTTTIGLSGNVSIRDNQRNEDIFYRYENLPDLEGTSTRYSRQTEDDFGYDLNLDFKKEFKRPGEVLTFNGAYGRNKEDGVNTFNQAFSNPLSPADRQINDTYERGNNINLQLDYTRPINEDSKFEAGYRTTIEQDDESQISTRFDPASNRFLPDYNVSNKFNLEEIVHAGYFNYQNKLNKNLGYQIGLRAEQAYLNTVTENVNPTTPENERFTPGRLDYFRVYPSIFLTQSFSNEQQLQLSYTRRVNRPNGWQVNPFINISDPLNIRQGNPNLKPEDIHSFELGYTREIGNTTLTSSIYHRRVNDVIQSITQRIEGSNAATISEWRNISKNESTGFELISKSGIGKAVDVTGNLNVFYNRFEGATEFNLPPREGINWDANLSTNIRFSKTLSAQIRADYRAPRVLAQGRSIGNFATDAALRWSILNNKGSLLFNVRDVFNQRRFGGYTQTEQFIRNFRDRRSLRMAMLTFSYRFGGTSDRDKDTKENWEDGEENNQEP
jgi:outer membrane receptor protein involved in Fe transport